MFSVPNARTNWDIATVSADGGEPQMIVETPADERGGRVSPDGRWLAYTAREGGGRYEILRAALSVRRREMAGVAWRRHAAGVAKGWPRVVLESPERNLMAVAVKPGGADFAFGEAQRLMAARTAGWEGGNAMGAQYAATADGQRFLISTAAEIPPINVVLNWAAAPNGNPIHRSRPRERNKIYLAVNWTRVDDGSIFVRLDQLSWRAWL